MTNPENRASFHDAEEQFFAVDASANGEDDLSHFSSRASRNARHDPWFLRTMIRLATDLLEEIEVRHDDPKPDGAAGTAPTPNAPLLSERETEVMTWVAEGKSNSVIATILGISPHTVDTHLRRAFQKLDTTSRTVAAVRAVQGGLITKA
ncbi:helix-turn-helix transcriptional regulator [Aliiruegeria sabulilitoris]|uniref:helix-turn-helix transcriptional regulator n=1 Tax=Aliiruegeria sabulilitoris TaxID=1510458 RepID=UPI0008302172|nr:LuxR C-terminal-related transcriptional regulator [Aliiruegeria sabulilitoris]